MEKPLKTLILTVGMVILLASAAAPDGISGWRGDGTGVYPAADPPTSWDADAKKGILWSVKVGPGFATPAVAGDRVFVSVQDDKLVCVDAKAHKVLWEKRNAFEDLPKDIKVEEKNYPTECGYATATPVTDGKLVWATYGTGIVACYDLDGNRKWILWIDYDQQSEHGRTASPLLVDGKLIVTIGRLVALDPATGRKLWDQEKAAEGLPTPAVAKIGDTTVLITGSGDVVRVSDGELVEAGIASSSIPSPVVKDGVVYFVDTSTTAVKLPAKLGEKKSFKKLWTADIEGDVFASPVVFDGIVYAVGNAGVLYAFDAAKGDVVWQKKIPIGSMGGGEGAAPANLYPSLAIAGGKLYVFNDRGETLVLQPGKEYKELSKNQAEEGSGACAAFDGAVIYERGSEKLYCIGK